jgi:esterase/lipase superfamily enzyme
VLARILLVFIAVSAAVGASLGPSRGEPVGSLPEPCRRAAASEKLAALEKRKTRLERAIARAREKADKAKADKTKADKTKADRAKADRADADDSTAQLSKSQLELLEVLFQIDCAKTRQQLAELEAGRAPAPAPKGSPHGSAKGAPQAAPKSLQDDSAAPLPPPPGTGSKKSSTRSLRNTMGEPVIATPEAVQVTTYFATNRGHTGASDPDKAYNASVAKLSYGRAVVSIPSAHKAGSLELPTIWKLELRADPSRHFILKEAVALDAGEARAEMIARLKEGKSKSLLVFVHGYNMSFAETAMRTAQLAYDLSFPGIPFFFSWPSAGQYTGYLHDAETAQLSEDAFDQVVDDLSRLPVTDIYVIAHSMGSRVVSQALRSRVDRGKRTSKISELLLAAPDINAELFRTVIAPRLKALQGTQTTVYASSLDLALRASKAVHGYRRVGETAGGVQVYPGLDTIDASHATLSVRAFGHSYLTDSTAVLKDIAAIVRQKLPARLRGLAQLGASPDFYWSLAERR